jgi:pyruvate-ferredoxin/flavodoxin oxidoreductase
MADPVTTARAVLELVDEPWQRHRASLGAAFTDAIQGLEELVQADDYHHRARDQDQLERSLGPLGKSNLDVGALSNLLGESAHSRAMSSDRLTRVRALIPELVQMREELPGTLVESALFVNIERDLAEILSLAEDHLERASQVFRTLRKAQMEVRSKYEPELHDHPFEDFRWRQLAPNELRLCPPFVVVGRLDQHSSATLLKAISLLETNLPMTILLLRSSVRGAQQIGADTSVPATLSVEMLPVAMRGVHVAQACAPVDGFPEKAFGALEAPRPAVLSQLVARDGEGADAFKKRAEDAIRSRAFPIFSFDPDRSEHFVECFDLTSNPAPDETWTIARLRGPDSQGHPIDLEEAFTFAHFAAQEPEFETDYSDPPEGADDLVPMAEYLDLERRQRADKRAFVWRRGEDGCLVRNVVSNAVALQCAERLHLWRTLRELSGLNNPHAEAARAALERELNEQQQAAAEQLRAETERLRAEMEATMAEREQAAVATAVERLVTNLATRATD